MEKKDSKLNRQVKNKHAILLIIAIISVSGIVITDFYSKKEIIFDKKTAEQLAYEGQNLIVIKPVFTATAYSKNGFYDYYTRQCDESCLEIPIRQGKASNWLAWNMVAIKAFKQLGYPMLADNILDLQLKKHPSFLDQYETVILLHNEYVTQEIFDAVTAHKNVIYLYPNALYAEIEHSQGKIKLIKGHGYPSIEIDNGFGWKYDNTRPDEFDRECGDWFFKHIENGWQLNCYPELVLKEMPEILKMMRSIINNEQIMK